MAKADLGTKRACLACGMRFYDFSRSPILCPGCGAEFDPEKVIKSRKGRSTPKTIPRDDVGADDDDEVDHNDTNEPTETVVGENDPALTQEKQGFYSPRAQPIFGVKSPRLNTAFAEERSILKPSDTP